MTSIINSFVSLFKKSEPANTATAPTTPQGAASNLEKGYTAASKMNQTNSTPINVKVQHGGRRRNRTTRKSKRRNGRGVSRK